MIGSTSVLRRLAGVLLFTLILAGCQTVNEGAGSGQLILSSGMTRYVQKYLDERRPGALAVTLDGQCSSYRYCPALVGSCLYENTGYLANQACESHCNRTCKVLLLDRRVVWNGPIVGLPEEVQRPQDRAEMTRSRPIRMPVEPTTRIPIWQAKGCAAPDATLFDGKPGSAFRDCPECPEMVVVPAGAYAVGSTAAGSETPVHEVTFAKPFAVGKYEVTFDEWEACAADGGCNGYVPSDRGWGRGRQPVIGVSWYHAKTYVDWLSKKTGGDYRLPSEAEWEYAARAGACTTYWWGDDVGNGNARCSDCGSNPIDVGSNQASGGQVGQYPPNAFGLYDTAGNVLEWVEDCKDTYEQAKADGSATETGRCDERAARGGSAGHKQWQLRPETRLFLTANRPNNFTGFRVAKTLK